MTKGQAISAVRAKLRSALGMGETPAGSNRNPIVTWYNKVVEAIGPGPWCQMTMTWAFWTALPKRIVKGRAYTVWAAQDFVSRVLGGTWFWGLAGAQVGDMVFFDWSGVKGRLSVIDHVGFIEKVNDDGSVYTLEGNFGNHLVRMHRDGKYVVGRGRPDYGIVATAGGTGGTSAPKPSGKTIPGHPDLPLLKIDGDWGSKTETAFRRLMGKSSHKYAVQALQIWLNANGHRDRDGRRLVTDGAGLASNSGRRYPSSGWTRTITAIQHWARKNQSGYLDADNSELVRWLQAKMNTGRFPD